MNDLMESLDAAMAALDSYGFTRAAETVERASAELARLRAENEWLRADAARFRWLVDTADPSWTVQMFENYETGEVRDVIDAAMAQGKV